MRLFKVVEDYIYYNKISQREFSRQTGINVASLNRWLKHGTLPNVDNMTKLFSWLLTEEKKEG